MTTRFPKLLRSVLAEFLKLTASQESDVLPWPEAFAPFQPLLIRHVSFACAWRSMPIVTRWAASVTHLAEASKLNFAKRCGQPATCIVTQTQMQVHSMPSSFDRTFLNQISADIANLSSYSRAPSLKLFRSLSRVMLDQKDDFREDWSFIYYGKYPILILMKTP